jgi:hypothetical protein
MPSIRVGRGTSTSPPTALSAESASKSRSEQPRADDKHGPDDGYEVGSSAIAEDGSRDMSGDMPGAIGPDQSTIPRHRALALRGEVCPLYRSIATIFPASLSTAAQSTPLIHTMTTRKVIPIHTRKVHPPCRSAIRSSATCPRPRLRPLPVLSVPARSVSPAFRLALAVSARTTMLSEFVPPPASLASPCRTIAGASCAHD